MAMFCLLVSTFILVSIDQVSTEGILGQFGDAFFSEDVKEKGVRGVFLSPTAVYSLPVDAAIYQFGAYVVEQYPVWFQIWRPSDERDTMTYRLIGQVELRPQFISKYYNVSVPRDKPIIVQQGDMLGIFNEEDGSALGYQFLAGSDQSGSWYSATEEKTTFMLSDSRQFDKMMIPYRFSVQAYYDTDTLKYLNPSDPISTTEVNETQGQTEEIPVTSGTLNYTGNSLADRDQILSEGAKAMYLFTSIVFPTSVVLEFHAFFRKKQQVVFQVWRQYSDNSYALVGSYVHMPENVPAYEKVALSLGNYIFVQDKDILGVSFLSDVGPIAYRMSGFQDNKGPFLASIVNNRLPRTGEIVTFGTTHYPYDFAIGAIYDTDTDPGKYGVAPPSIIPKYPPEPTKPWDTDTPTVADPFTPFSVDVPKEHVLIGDKYLLEASSVLSTGAEMAFILSDMTVQSAGLIVALYAYAVQPGRFYFQIWRRYGNDDNRFELIGQKGLTIQGSEGEVFEPRLLQITLERDEQIFVEEGDCLGFRNDQESSVIGYQFQSTSMYLTAGPINPAIGDVVKFDKLPMPYKFSLAATMKIDPESSSSDEEVTSAPEDEGPESPGVERQVEITTESFPWIMDTRLMFGMLIWLILLTVLFLMLLVCFLCGVRKNSPAKEENKRTSFLYDYQSKNSVARTPSDYLTHSPNKEADVISYFNPKTGSRSGPVMRNDSMREQLIESEPEDKYTGAVAGNVNNNNKRPNSIYSDYSDGTVTVITHKGDLHTHM